MANKLKTKIPNNLLSIRVDLGYSQKEFGELLDVSERQICNYETDETSNLPIDKAVFISKKWNYSLDYIYCNTDSFQKKSSYYPENENNNFLVDIRDFFSMKDNNIVFTLPNYFWKYIKEKEHIILSSDSSKEKERAIAQLNAKYPTLDNTNIYFEHSIPCNEFISCIQLGDSSCPYISDEDIPHKKPTPEQLNEATTFLEDLSSNNNKTPLKLSISST